MPSFRFCGSADSLTSNVISRDNLPIYGSAMFEMHELTHLNTKREGE